MIEPRAVAKPTVVTPAPARGRAGEYHLKNAEKFLNERSLPLAKGRAARRQLPFIVARLAKSHGSKRQQVNFYC
jgi:hypothetical protein